MSGNSLPGDVPLYKVSPCGLSLNGRVSHYGLSHYGECSL